jgi:lysophospholipase L1-like esterase
MSRFACVVTLVCVLGGGCGTSDDKSGSGGSGGSGGTATTGGAPGTGGGSGGSTGGAGVDAAVNPDGGSGGAGGTGGTPVDAGPGSDVKLPIPDASANAYNPCPPKGTPCNVMPLGDSITYGDGSSDLGGYRVPLFRLILANKQTVNFVGLMSDGPDTVEGVPFPKHHEGHSGYQIAGNHGILGFTPDAIKGHKPNIVLLMIGTNDFAFSDDPANAHVRLGQLLDAILTADPNLHLVVAQIVPINDPTKNAQVMTFNANIPALVKARQDAGKHISMVDMYTPLASAPDYKTRYFKDTYHPNDAGYAKMAEAWYPAIGALLR